tara:strand:- start:261 stop:785 length:525 start_codon:yes stop_codon:yes gene_type:complete
MKTKFEMITLNTEQYSAIAKENGLTISQWIENTLKDAVIVHLTEKLESLKGQRNHHQEVLKEKSPSDTLFQEKTVLETKIRDLQSFCNPSQADVEKEIFKTLKGVRFSTNMSHPETMVGTSVTDVKYLNKRGYELQYQKCKTRIYSRRYNRAVKKIRGFKKRLKRIEKKLLLTP